MGMAIQETFHTVQEVAEELSVTEGRIRQILTRDAPSQDVSIGKKFGPNWILTDKDVAEIKPFIRKFREMG